METMTSENIYRIEITESNVPAQILEKQIKTENISTKTITKLETLVWWKKVKQLSILNRINAQKQKSAVV